MKTVVYDDGDKVIGEVEVYVDDNKNPCSYEIDELLKNGLKIRELSKGGDRCHPLAVIYTISSEVCFKLIEYKSPLLLFHEDSSLFRLHSVCLRENKTVVLLSNDTETEIHLVAMRSRRANSSSTCFWAFRIPQGSYQPRLAMLNLRCLNIVFDLDETLIVANTLRSFDDRINSLQRRISIETDSQRIAGMTAEMNRYQDDRCVLKMYAETDQVVLDGKVHRFQPEVVHAVLDEQQTVVRPVIRLLDKNIVLTRINPQVRDTSVLVRLRPAWADLRNYLTAKGRKRFEVYVCTMAERDYALEMWRLLDPDSNLINTSEVLDRIVCVKSGSKKALLNVFHNGICNPEMGLVIDDRLDVWDEKDQARVHVVPAFAPYYAPQAEANTDLPVLCVARNVACNIRARFFKEFDDVLLQRITEVSFEDDLKDVPCPPDVSSYNKNDATVLQENSSDSDANKNLNCSKSSNRPRLVQSGPSELGLVGRGQGVHDSVVREEGEVPEPELDPDTRRRLLILQHGHDVRDPGLGPTVPWPVPVASLGPVQAPGPVIRMQSRGAEFRHLQAPRIDDRLRFNHSRPVHQSFEGGGSFKKAKFEATQRLEFRQDIQPHVVGAQVRHHVYTRPRRFSNYPTFFGHPHF